MKIIIRDANGGIKRCFAQVRDVDYLAKRFNSIRFKKLALDNASYRDLKNDDFFEVRNLGVAQIIEENPFIVDFCDLVNFDVLSLTRMIILAQSAFPSEKRKLDEDKKVDDLLDLINFKKGMLTYQMPVFFDEKKLIQDGDIVFGSTTLPDYYMLRSSNPDVNLLSYLEKNSQALFDCLDIEEDMESYDTIEVGKDVLVRFKVKKNLISKMKKRFGIK